MTTPAERTNAVINMGRAVEALAPYLHGRGECALVPRETVRDLFALLRHYPTAAYCPPTPCPDCGYAGTGDCSCSNSDIGVDHLAVLESMIVDKDSMQNRALRACAYELRLLRAEVECLRSVLEEIAGASGFDNINGWARNKARQALGNDKKGPING